MAYEQEDGGSADFAAGVVGCIVCVITFFVLSTLMSAGWAVAYGFVLGSVFSWATWVAIKRRKI